MAQKIFSIETCSDSPISVKESIKGGADKIQLCCSIPEGGCTPSLGLIEKCLEISDAIEYHIMIRPRGGDFLYTEDELSIMEKDIDTIITNYPKVRGFMFGCLTEDGDVNIDSMKRLVSHCKGYCLTFNRAFDMCKDPIKALTDIISIGFNRILTSGQKLNATLGQNRILELQKQAAGRILIVPCCGIDANNIGDIKNATGCTQFLIDASILTDSEMKYQNNDVSMGGASAFVNDEFAKTLSSGEVIKETRALIDEL